MKLNEGRPALTPLRILAWDPHGIRCKKQELQELIVARMDLDIILFSETHLEEVIDLEYLNILLTGATGKALEVRPSCPN
jgi:hypothetical protein